MINILIQIDDDGSILDDFCWFAIQSIKYNEWFNNTKLFNVFYKTIDDIKDLPLNYTPIGSIEFIHKHMKLLNINIPKAINIPDELNKFEYLQRTIKTCYKKDISKYPVFIKPKNEIKLFTGGVISSKTNLDLILSEIKEDTLLLTSDVIEDIKSEYRCFIYKQKLQSLKFYNNDFTLFPDINIINLMISDYKNAPIAYTLDVGIIKNIKNNKYKTILIECHNFYSVGLYGFNNDNLIYMFVDAFDEIKNK